MATYLIVNRPPHDYMPSARAAREWNAWFEELGGHLVDRGNPAFASRALGAPAAQTALGGYTLVVAENLDAAVALAEACPMLRAGGGVEVGELTESNRPRVTGASVEQPAARYSSTTTVYIGGTPQQVWRGLTEADATAAWWAHRNVSTWSVGEPWAHERIDDSSIADIAGTVIEAHPPTRLVLTWANPSDGTPVGGASGSWPREPSRVRFELAPHAAITRLTVTHDRLLSTAERDALSAGWSAVLANLKTFIETGRPLPTPPWDMLAGFVRVYPGVSGS